MNRSRLPIYARLAEKTVFITGGGGGIGAAFTCAFALQGARVCFVDNMDEASQTLIQQIRGETGKAPWFVSCDVRDIAALQGAIEKIRIHLRDIGILINNAGNDDRHTVEEVVPSYWDERVSVNLRHMFFAAQAVLPQMKRLGGGQLSILVPSHGDSSWRTSPFTTRVRLLCSG